MSLKNSNGTKAQMAQNNQSQGNFPQNNFNPFVNYPQAYPQAFPQMAQNNPFQGNYPQAYSQTPQMDQLSQALNNHTAAMQQFMSAQHGMPNSQQQMMVPQQQHPHQFPQGQPANTFICITADELAKFVKQTKNLRIEGSPSKKSNRMDSFVTPKNKQEKRHPQISPQSEKYKQEKTQENSEEDEECLSNDTRNHEENYEENYEENKKCQLFDYEARAKYGREQKAAINKKS